MLDSHSRRQRVAYDKCRCQVGVSFGGTLQQAGATRVLFGIRPSIIRRLPFNGYIKCKIATLTRHVASATMAQASATPYYRGHARVEGRLDIFIEVALCDATRPSARSAECYSPHPMQLSTTHDVEAMFRHDGSRCSCLDWEC